MAHFAEVAGGIVQRVLVVPDGQQHRGHEYMADDMGLGGVWIQTSYNTYGNVHYGSDGEPDGGTPAGYNYAATGFTYDAALGAFRAPQPWPSWLLDTDTQLWEAPVAVPDDGVTYYWDEDTTSWVEPV